MNIHSQIALSVGLLLSSFTARAQVTCVSGKPSQTNMVLQMHNAKSASAVTEAIYKQYKLSSSTQAKAPCTECSGSVAKRPDGIAQVASAIEGIPQAPKLLFNPACLRASNNYEASAGQVSCPGGRSSKSANLCQTEEILNYQNATISSFISCSKKLGLPTVSPSVLYGIYSLESGFKPQYSSGSGVGLGQLTNIFVQDIHQSGRGKENLSKMAQSDLQECSAAKILAQKDLKSKPRLSNACSFIQIGDGMERNILYTMLGLATSWEKDISPKMSVYVTKYANHPAIEDIKSLLMANAYGSGGRAAARALANRLSALPPDKLLAAIKKPISGVPLRGARARTLNGYTMKIAARQKQISSDLKDSLKASFEKEGSKACVNQ